MSKKISKAEQSEEIILQAATNLFLTQDYNTISTQMIADEATKIAKSQEYYRNKISKASIFNHFESKENLAMTIFERMGEGMAEEMLNVDFSGDDMVFLENVCRYSLQYMFEYPAAMKFFMQIASELLQSGNEEHWLKVEKLFDEYRGAFSTKFTEMGIPNPEIKAHLMFAALDGLGLHLYMLSQSGAEIDFEPYVVEFMSIIKAWKNESGEKS